MIQTEITSIQKKIKVDLMSVHENVNELIKSAEFIIINVDDKDSYKEAVELKKVQGTTASYAYQKEDVFVRVKINSDAKKDNPIIEGETKKAWTQPVLVQ